MTTRMTTFPYLQPTAKLIKPSPWNVRIGDGYEVLPDALTEWDPTVTLELIRKVVLNLDAIRAECGLDATARLRLGVAWECGGTNLRGRGESVDLHHDTTEPDHLLSLFLPGEQLAGRVDLRTTLILAHNPSPKPLRLSRPGGVLWEETRSIALEGQGARFPTEAIDFAKCGWEWPEGAAWRLEWDADELDLPVLGGLRLYLNKGHATIAEAITDPLAPTSKLLIGAIHFEVGRSLILGALRNPDFAEEGCQYEAESIGRMLRRLITVAFGDESLETLRQEALQRPDLFDSRLQAALSIFRAG